MRKMTISRQKILSLECGKNGDNQTPLWRAFSSAASRSPQEVACCGSKSTVTYSQMYSMVLCCSNYLAQVGVKEDSRVSLILPKDIQLLVYLLACWKIGASVLILDEDAPQEQINHRIHTANADIIIGSNFPEYNTAAFDMVTTLKSGELNQFSDNTFQSGIIDESLSPQVDRLASMIFTSGSTGAPKCVGLSHIGLLNTIIGLVGHYKLRASSRVAWAASLSFDSAIAEPLLALLSGATLMIPDTREPLIGSYLEKFVHQKEITHLILTPTVLETTKPQCIPAGITIALVGEPLSPATLTRWADNRTLYNAYGPSEASICATITSPLCAGDEITVGWPLPGVEISIVDENLEPVPNYVIGEIIISGLGISLGYLNDAEATKSVFINAGPDGERCYLTGDIGFKDDYGQLVLKGRKDSQVKIDGRRIDLADVERVLGLFGPIRQVAAVKQDRNGGKALLVAYIVTDPGRPPPTVQELRGHASKSLPHHMVPSKWYWVAEMPVTQNGKLDRRKLVDLAAEELMCAGSRPAEGVLEARIADIFSQILQLDRIGRSDDFFALGGTSLDVIRFIEKLRIVFETDFNSGDLLEEPTVAGVAKRLCTAKVYIEQPNNLPPETEPDVLPSSVAYTPVIWHEHYPQKVFLTGGTGFFGSGILEALLTETSALIICAVRSPVAGQVTRLTSAMRKARTWNLQWEKRIKTIQLDLTDLHVQKDKVTKTVGDVDLIIHCGANVNLAYDYNSLSRENVFSTSVLVELAATGTAKRFLYVSSRSAIDPTDISGYGQSKRAAEKIMIAAFKRGLAGLIVRPGRITGHTEQEGTNPNDFIVRYLTLCHQLGKYPRGLGAFYGVPVDTLSNQLVRAIIAPSIADNPIIEPADSEMYVFDEIFEQISMLGTEVQAVDVQEWLSTVYDVEMVGLEVMYPDVLIAVRDYWEQMKHTYLLEQSAAYSATTPCSRSRRTSALARFVARKRI
ncbi:non-ribosomal peptide synthetase [Photorhabdus cinerea]|uniref:Carrier domain-containing protein n=1 Tax=Photorhabdus cinerea TaxID=471575 RepID=A0A7X5QHD9_9GAMM|nr:non-ribosomal peptide synthetase [Photorhabdus cinerea]NHB94401.1 hypothetical protein [Photorhabdus cinerea]